MTDTAIILATETELATFAKAGTPLFVSRPQSSLENVFNYANDVQLRIRHGKHGHAPPAHGVALCSEKGPEAATSSEQQQPAAASIPFATELRGRDAPKLANNLSVRAAAAAGFKNMPGLGPLRVATAAAAAAHYSRKRVAPSSPKKTAFTSQ